MRSVFITGTGTGVGKTVVGGALCAYLSLKKGLDVAVMKPVETGWDPASSDAITLIQLSGSKEKMEDVVPYKFVQPVAPEVAARHENREVKIETLDLVYRKLLSTHDVVVVEGAGGILVPIREGFFFSDLIKLWKIPVIVVSENRLGTINHTLLTCHYLLSEGIEIVGVILNTKEETLDFSSDSNSAVLKKYLPIPLLGVFPHVGISMGDSSFRESLAEIFENNIDLSYLPF